MWCLIEPSQFDCSIRIGNELFVLSLRIDCSVAWDMVVPRCQSLTVSILLSTVVISLWS